ncbi:Protein sidekick-1 [Liparis tanakae]|uniref:Protein sidekick-1 n=1 Tax=Liparis tanakae TaxID=230148 RepID=A0A4Z2FNR7_9TELE|nr:Protein sidekick-1 [Liparis tanakae]
MNGGRIKRISGGEKNFQSEARLITISMRPIPRWPRTSGGPQLPCSFSVMRGGCAAVLYSEKDSEAPPGEQLAEGEGGATLLLAALRKHCVYALREVRRGGGEEVRRRGGEEGRRGGGYQISYCLDGGDPRRWTTVEVGSNARQFTVTGLSPEQAYVFRLTARTAVGWGAEQEALVVTTERRASTDVSLSPRTSGPSSDDASGGYRFAVM